MYLATRVAKFKQLSRYTSNIIKMYLQSLNILSVTTKQSREGLLSTHVRKVRIFEDNALIENEKFFYKETGGGLFVFLQLSLKFRDS